MERFQRHQDKSNRQVHLLQEDATPPSNHSPIPLSPSDPHKTVQELQNKIKNLRA